jgi:hypothetical protein
MEKKQFENKNFVLYAPDSLKHVYKDMESVLDGTLELYKKLFDVDDFRQVQINYFDDIDDFRNFIYDLRGEKDSLPKYAKGTFDKGMINAYIDPSITEKDDMFNKRVHLASHELFHIMYRELVIEKLHTKRVTWFDEGCAQFFSGEKEYEMNDGFSTWYKNMRDSIKEVSDLNHLSHGPNFCNEKYNGYDISLLAVKNIYERIGFNGIRSLLRNSNKILEYGDNVLQSANLFYDVKYRGSRGL